ncbi:MAG: GtrA family protein [Clostridiales bacterium]|nr:GtrA family protein [Clostridiales bacterium]
MERFWEWLENIKLYKYLSEHKLFGKIFNREMISYLFFGVTTTIIAVVSFWVYDKLMGIAGWMGIVHFFKPGKDYAYLDANVLSWITAVIYAYITNKKYVFHSEVTEKKDVMREFFSFIGARLLTLLIDEGLMLLFVSVMSMNHMIAKLIVQVVIVILNYVFSKLFVFRKPKELPETEDEGQ